jgi:hypothetical protein
VHEVGPAVAVEVAARELGPAADGVRRPGREPDPGAVAEEQLDRLVVGSRGEVELAVEIEVGGDVAGASQPGNRGEDVRAARRQFVAGAGAVAGAAVIAAGGRGRRARLVKAGRR